jgi:hypothetical protein
MKKKYAKTHIWVLFLGNKQIYNNLFGLPEQALFFRRCLRAADFAAGEQGKTMPWARLVQYGCR